MTAALGAVAAVVGILASIGVFDEDPTTTGSVRAEETATAVSLNAYKRDFDVPGPIGLHVPSHAEGHVYNVGVTLAGVSDARYEIRWTVREQHSGRPLQGRRNISAARVRPAASAVHRVWVPCAPGPEHVVEFELVEAGTDLLGSDVAPNQECGTGLLDPEPRAAEEAAEDVLAVFVDDLRREPYVVSVDEAAAGRCEARGEGSRRRWRCRYAVEFTREDGARLKCGGRIDVFRRSDGALIADRGQLEGCEPA